MCHFRESSSPGDESTRVWGLDLPQKEMRSWCNYYDTTDTTIVHSCKREISPLQPSVHSLKTLVTVEPDLFD